MGKKKVTLLLIVLAFLLKSQTSATTISLADRHAPPGSVIKVPLNINDGAGIAGAEVVFQYDQTLLEFQDVALTSFTEQFIITFKEKDNQVAVSLAGARGLANAKGILFYLTFRVKRSGIVGTTSEITIVHFNLYNESGELVSADAEHGVFKVSEIVVFPNPFTPNNDGFNDIATFIVPDSIIGIVSVKLYSVSGSKVAELSGANRTEIVWNGLDDKGNKLRPGPYIYLMQSASKTLSKGTITIMR